MLIIYRRIYFLSLIFILLISSKGFSESWLNRGVYEDSTNSLTIQEILAKGLDKDFKEIDSTNIVIQNTNSTFWVKYQFLNNSGLPYFSYFSSVFFIADIYEVSNGKIISKESVGSNAKFWERKLFALEPTLVVRSSPETKTYYIKLKSSIRTAIVGVDEDFFTFVNRNFLFNQYYGVFFGVIFVICLISLGYFYSLKEKLYLYYSLYIISFGIFAAIHYLTLIEFINFPFPITYSSFSIPYSCMTIFLLLYTKEFFNLKNNFPFLNKFILALSVIYIILIPPIVIYNQRFLQDKLDELFLVICLITGLYMLIKGVRLAHLYVIGLSFLIGGFTFFNYFNGHNNAYLTSYNSVFIEILIFAVSLSIRHKYLKKEREKKQLELMETKERLIRQLQEKERIKDSLNIELEKKVEERTWDLKEALAVVENQAKEIERMNLILRNDNQQLKADVSSISKARVEQKMVSFAEFKVTFPDDDACMKFLADRKSANGYSCLKCGSSNFFIVNGFSRKCSKCKYIESPTVNSIFYNAKFSLLKAFYILYIVSSGKKFTLEAIAEMLELRIGTAHNFIKKVKVVAEQNKKFLKAKDGWTNLIFCTPKIENEVKGVSSID